MELLKNSGSFRDPAGQIYEYDNRIIRIVKKFGKERYELIKKKNIIEESRLSYICFSSYTKFNCLY